MINSIRFRFTLGYIFLLALLGLGMLISLQINAMERQHVQNLEFDVHVAMESALLEGEIATLLTMTHAYAHSSDPDIRRAYDETATTLRKAMEILQRDSKQVQSIALAASLETVLQRSHNLIDRVAAGDNSYTEMDLLEQATRAFFVDVQQYNETQHGQITQLKQLFHQDRLSILYSAIGLLVVGGGAVALLSLLGATFLRPLNELGAALADVQDGTFERRLIVRAPRELLPLIERYNAMVTALQHRHQAFNDQLRRTALLTQLSIELREILDPATIMERGLQLVAVNLGVTHASILMVGPSGTPELGRSLYDGGIHSIPESTAQTILEHGLAGWVLRSGRSVIVPDIANDERWLSGTQDYHHGSVMVLLVRQARVTLGVLTIYHPVPSHFTNRDLLLMEGVAAQIGVALSAAQRYQDECQRREQALALFSMSQFLTSERSYADLTTMLRERIGTVFRADHGLLFLADASNATAPQMVAPDLAQHMDTQMVRRATVMASRAWAAQKIVTETAPLAEKTLTCVALPLAHNGQVIGSFVLMREGRNDLLFSANTWSLLTIFTNVIAATCANMRLIAQLRQHTETLEALVQQRTAELQRSRDLLRVIFDHLPEGLILLDAHETLLAANNVFCRGIVGRMPQAVVGRNYEMFWQELADRAELQMQPQDAPTETADPRRPMRVLCTDTVGQQRWFAVERIAIMDSGLVPEQYLERWRDITHQEELQRRLLLHEQLTSLGRLAASVAHEVGNPLQGAVACLELCREDPLLPGRAQEYLGLAYGELERMGRILEGLRRLYRPPQAVWERWNLNQILQEVQQFTQRQFAQSQVYMVLDLDSAMPSIYIQPDALRQVFLNLVLNAQEAMPNGGQIHVVSRWHQSERQCQVLVSDTGVGMSAGQLVRLFEPFHSRKAQGVGLGLYLSKQIIDQHGGSISVRSQVQQGTVVEVVLPCSGGDGNGACDNPTR